MTTVTTSGGGAKLTFEGICDLTLGEDVRRWSTGEAFNSLLSTEDTERESNGGCGGNGRSKSRRRGGKNNRRDVTYWKYKESGDVKNQC